MCVLQPKRGIHIHGVDILKMFEPADQNNGMNSFIRFFDDQAVLLYIVTSLIYIQREKNRA